MITTQFVYVSKIESMQFENVRIYYWKSRRGDKKKFRVLQIEVHPKGPTKCCTAPSICARRPVTNEKPDIANFSLSPYFDALICTKRLSFSKSWKRFITVTVDSIIRSSHFGGTIVLSYDPTFICRSDSLSTFNLWSKPISELVMSIIDGLLIDFLNFCIIYSKKFEPQKRWIPCPGA